MDEDKEDVNGVRERSDDEMSEKAESEEKPSDCEQESDEDKGKKKGGSEKSSTKKRASGKAKTKELKISKKASPPPKKSLPKSPNSEPRKKDDKNAKKSSGKKKDQPIKKSSPKKSASKEESIGKKLMKVRDFANAKFVRTNSPSPYNDLLCYSTPEGFTNFLNMTLHFEGIANLRLPPENLFMQVQRNIICLAFTVGDKIGSRMVLGTYQQQNIRFVYDLCRRTVSFANEDCSKDHAANR